MTRSDHSRYAVVSRRTALTGAMGAALLALAACSSDDSALAGTGASSSSSTEAPSTAPSTAASSPASSASPSASTSSSSTSKAGLPTSAKLSVAFTFAAESSGGPMRNPYVAVWLESAAGQLVKTVALWHEDHNGQDRWLSEMKAFSALNAADAETVTSATRQPGSYTVDWDGSTASGGRAPAGTYQLFIEAAREHGPYELLQHAITVGSKAASINLTPNGELTQASAKYTV